MPSQHRTRSGLSWVRLAREMRGISQQDLAEQIGCTQAQLSRYESGRRVPPAARRARIAQALAVDERRLFGDRAPEDVVGAFLSPNGLSPTHDPDEDPDVEPAPEHLRARAADFVLDFEQASSTTVDKQGRKLWTDFADGRRLIYVPEGAAVMLVPPTGASRRTPGRSNRPGRRRAQRSKRASSDGSQDGPEPHQRGGRA